MVESALSAIQGLLKQQYREEPGAAQVTLRATGQLGEAVSCSVETGRGIAVAGLHAATGGDGQQLCSGNMLLEALVACAGVTLCAVATAMSIVVRAGRIWAEGEIDFRGTLGVSRDTPVGFQRLSLHFDIDTDAQPEAHKKLLELTGRYCVVYQTLRQPPVITTNANA